MAVLSSHESESGNLSHSESGSTRLCHHDPKGIIMTGLSDTAAIGSNAREVLFAWLLGLPASTDPSRAAGQILATYEPFLESPLNERQSELMALLRQVSEFDRTKRLAARSAGRRRSPSLH